MLSGYLWKNNLAIYICDINDFEKLRRRGKWEIVMMF